VVEPYSFQAHVLRGAWAKGVRAVKKPVVLVLVFVLLVGVIGTASAGANTIKETGRYQDEFEDMFCSNVPAWVELDGIYTVQVTENENTLHVNFKMDAEVKVWEDETKTTLISTDRLHSLFNENINKQNRTTHHNHVFKGQLVDGTKWHGILIEQLTLSANGDVVVEFVRDKFIHCS
jgi:hypothetical protein